MEQFLKPQLWSWPQILMVEVGVSEVEKGGSHSSHVRGNDMKVSLQQTTHESQSQLDAQCHLWICNSKCIVRNGGCHLSPVKHRQKQPKSACYFVDKAKESVLKITIHLWMVRHNLLPRSHTAPIKVGLHRQRELCVRNTLSSGKYLGPKEHCLICSLDCISSKNNRGHSLSNLNHMLKFRFSLQKVPGGTQDPHMK